MIVGLAGEFVMSDEFLNDLNDHFYDCPNCGLIFEPKLNQIYCSKKCKTDAKERRRRNLPSRKYIRKLTVLIDKICLHCNIQFTTLYPEKKYCSDDCRIREAKIRGAPKRQSNKKKRTEKRFIATTDSKINIKLTDMEYELLKTRHIVQPEYYIYFLMDEDKVAYVGSSRKAGRIDNHLHSREMGVMKFDRIEKIIMPSLTGLRKQENRFIYYYKSIGQAWYNKITGTPRKNHPYYQPKSPIVYESILGDALDSIV